MNWVYITGWVFFAVSASAANFCELNSANTSCSAPTESQCRTKCSLYSTNSSCSRSAAPNGCIWATIEIAGQSISMCSPNDASSFTCLTQDTESNCNSKLQCSWVTNPCEFKSECRDADQIRCVCGRPNCKAEASCTSTTTCAIPTDQSACVGIAGCFWSQETTSFSGFSAPTSACNTCVVDPDKRESLYLAYQAKINKECFSSSFGLNLTVKVSAVFPSFTGCTGGIPASQRPSIRDSCDTDSSTIGSTNSSTANSAQQSSVSILFSVLVVSALWMQLS